MTEKSPRQAIDPRFVRALSHPVRAEILQVLIGEREVSSNLIAAQVEAKSAVVHYHLTVLQQCEAVELSRTEQQGGLAEHFFRPVALPFLAADSDASDDLATDA
jgi:DNA-binding transcriptional ArsR family regulator